MEATRDAAKSSSRKQLALQRRLDALFRALASDFLLREQFITDPAQIASEYIAGKRIPAEQAGAMNYLIYSCLGNDYLISWFRDYAMLSDGRTITQQSFLRDFSRAVVEQRAHHVVSALTHFALSDKVRIRLDDDWLQAIFSRWHRFGDDNGTDDATDSTGTDDATDSTGTDDATDITGTDDATDITGTDTTGTGTGSTGTGTGTGTGTDVTGTGTDATGTDGTGTDPGATLTAITWKTYITETTDQTHSSTTPFTHTGMTRSPITTATTLNTDRFLGTSHVIITLEALTIYARQLIRAGALDELIGEQA